MAGVKITDLPPLTTAVSGDLLYIVDISNTTESPEGTSSKITLGNLTNSLDMASGTWTPVFSGFLNAVISATVDSATYSKVGSIVTCTIRGTVEIDFSSDDAGEFDFTFPIATTSDNANGVVSLVVSNQINGYVRNGSIALTSSDTSLISSATQFFAIFQYEIV
jgi:hypothetical protein